MDDMSEAKRTVLVVDDEPKIVDVVSSYLERSGYVPVAAATGRQALSLFEQERPCLVILDLMLPDLSGEEVCRRLRARSRIPIIMLTARADDSDAVKGLDLGADDYVAKPFSPRQLMARVAAVLRRASADGSALATVLAFGGEELRVDVTTRQVKVRGVEVSLTPSEYDILRVLASSPGRVFSRADLIAFALGGDFDGFDRTIDAHVKNLRQKIEADSRRPRYVLTVHGVGYRFAGGEA